MSRNLVKKSVLAGALPLALILTGCGGGVGESSGGDAGSGFEFGAPQEEVDAAIADLEPVTLAYQPYAPSQNSTSAPSALAFMEAVEERSGGKISFDVSWAQAIAPYPEVDDALADGRLDLAFAVPIYYVAEYPMTDAYNKLSYFTPGTPMVGEAALQAQMAEAGWNDPNVLQQFEDQSVTPLNPLVGSGTYWTACGEEGTAREDLQGSQIRIGGAVQTPISQALGASPVSMEYHEAFEALQRGTVDCMFTQGLVAGSTGLVEAAPHLSAFDGDERFTGAVTAAFIAGAGYESLPLAYKQIIFDAAGIDWQHGWMHSNLESSAQATADAVEHGGSFTATDEETKQIILDTQTEIADQMIADGVVSEEVRAGLEESGPRWMQTLADLGYEEGGDVSELHEWYDPETDFRPLFEEAFNAGAVDHRPA
ncbi:C4-dicarboxylate ABC transporter substrate-binding protein [Brevibacterium litoralis]|uniref:C4-dicarboxylate ABC transporter substrate-binding protein n=1 Tax=Brevibacterium litoralis TaxID=3138935 RepID=UPI0032EC0E7E